MKRKTGASLEGLQERIATLKRQLQMAHERLRKLAGGEADAGLPEGVILSADEDWQSSNERFRSMFITSSTGMAISTPQGHYLEANAAYCRMLGYTREELLTRDFASLTHPEDLDLNLKLRDELLAGRRESFVIEKRYLKKNGDIVWTRHSVSAPHTAAGDIATLMVVAEVRIAPRVEGGTLELEVADNGRGIRATEVTGIRGLGLLGMRERALAAGGGIIVEGPAGGGAIGTARLPIVQPGNAS